MADLSVSYKSEDRTRVAPQVCTLKADGVGVWRKAQIGSGTEWRESIESELNAPRRVLVVSSERSTGAGTELYAQRGTRFLRRGAPPASLHRRGRAAARL